MPRGPALLGLSWDGGQASKRRSYTPILVSVANTDSASSTTCHCIGYLPKCTTVVSSDVKRVLVQRCIGAILKVVNSCATRGFTCRLHATNTYVEGGTRAGCKYVLKMRLDDVS